MATISEDQLSVWTKPAFENEDERRRNTEAMIAEAIKGHALLRTLPIKVYAKGSYKNNTNVRRDSDVDVAVEYTDIIFATYQRLAEAEQIDRAFGLTSYTGPFRDRGDTPIGEFKDAVGEALRGAFGAAAVTRHNKVFTVREGSRSLAADVVPCGTHRHYFSTTSYEQGIRLLPDKRTFPPVDNYPQQHYDNGVAKNERCSRRFKSVVRILKNLENKMVADGTSPQVASYLIECLVYNAPDWCFDLDSWSSRTWAVLAHARVDLHEADASDRWMEVNGIKFLFRPSQKWTIEEAQGFVAAALKYVRES